MNILLLDFCFVIIFKSLSRYGLWRTMTRLHQTVELSLIEALPKCLTQSGILLFKFKWWHGTVEISLANYGLLSSENKPEQTIYLNLYRTLRNQVFFLTELYTWANPWEFPLSSSTTILALQMKSLVLYMWTVCYWQWPGRNSMSWRKNI